MKSPFYFTAHILLQLNAYYGFYNFNLTLRYHNFQGDRSIEK